MSNSNGSIFSHWIRNEKPAKAISLIAAATTIFVIALWLIMLIGTSAHRRISSNLNPPQIIVISDTEAELHMLNNLLEHLKTQHYYALRASRRSNNAHVRTQHIGVASDIESLMREVIEAINTGNEAR